ncbi:palmitoyl-protein thioesterase 1-like [Olea europaea var. sylvestris]|uniref:palmitoyl-protein thioesterase 1-like n=1 Tax=Olea europaea var. sylvestris TaxID=158386 RepID=UPI000C1D2B01|nr:palmitoyl-protein thioesterase 1-like [Olea europaea var. sylvestris]
MTAIEEMAGMDVLRSDKTGTLTLNKLTGNFPFINVLTVYSCNFGLISPLFLQSALEHLAPANYIKIPTDINEYNKGCRFLPKLNNELHRNSAYKERFASLQGLVLIMFENDTILVPKETSWFGYFPDSSWTPVLPAQETTLYTEDRIGLKSLDEAGKVKFVKVSGGHLEISYSAMKEHILPYLVENATTRLIISSESSHIWPWSEHEGERLQLYTAN